MASVRILVADDHDLLRRGLRNLLEAEPGWEVCGEAHNGVEAVAKAEQLKPDVAILDISMPEMNGLEAARRIKKASAKTEILALSMNYSDQLIREVVDTGARGNLVKTDSDRDLVVAVRALANHKPFFTPHATELMLGTVKSTNAPGEPQSPKERLTSRERQIVQLLSEGKTSKEVGAALGISAKTAETHRANVMRKLKVHTVTDLVRYALRNSIIGA